MTTQLKRYREAYASMVVAVYEPLIVGWVSGTTVNLVAETTYNYATYGTVKRTAAPPASPAGPTPEANREAGDRWSVDTIGGVLSPELVHGTPGLASSVQIGNSLYPSGVVMLAHPDEGPGDGIPHATGDPVLGAQTVTVVTAPGLVGLKPLPDADGVLPALIKDLEATFGELSTLPAQEARQAVLATAKKYFGPDDYKIFKVDDAATLEEILSPLGVAHFYRQLYFNLDEGVGPIEEAFTIAPLESFEVVYETSRRQIHEEVLETGLETNAETTAESHNLEEVSDKVSSMIQRDASAAMSASASYTTPTFQIGVSASGSLQDSTQRGREQATRRLKEVTTRASERITKTFTLRTRAVDELTTAATTRRLIRNEQEHPVSYGLRRVLRRVRVKVQDLGPRLVWQLYVRDPGAGLARSRFVHFAAGQPITVPDVPPGVPARPQGGSDTGSSVCAIKFKGTAVLATSPDQPVEPADYSGGQPYVSLSIAVGPERKITAVVIDSMADVGDPKPQNDRGEPAPVRYGTLALDQATNVYSIEIFVRPGDSMSMSVNYTYVWEPSGAALAEWEKQRKAVVDQLTQQQQQGAFEKAFEREKALITERSKIRPRPAADLRREERYELMERLVARLFATKNTPADPTPLAIESFHRFFDVEGIFSYAHPAWWKPRYTREGPLIALTDYELTAESEPAPMGRSLGWRMQLDGDTRRNEFLNSPWARVCVPIRPGRERQAAEWLAGHVEGEVGFDVTSSGSPLKKLVDEISAFRANESKLGVDGPDFVEVNSTVGAPTAGPLTPESVYPVIDEFDVTVPTDGFVYDELTIQAS